MNGAAVASSCTQAPIRMCGTSLPRPQGWPLERVVSLLGGSLVVASLALARAGSPRWRLVTTAVGVNLALNGVAGWCPASLALHRLGLTTTAERLSGRDQPGEE